MRALAPGMPVAAARKAAARSAATAPIVPDVPAAPALRLRFVLFGLLGYALYSLSYPRLSAAWKLHGRATALADYGACMAGPTGPGLLRDHQADDFKRLLRRRLVAAAPGDAPFERCATLARGLTESAEIESAHKAQARTFAEYGATGRAERSLASLGSAPGGLSELARAAWPFVRGYALLVKPSLGAKEAPHPVAAPTPANGRGLPSGRPLYRATRVDEKSILYAAGTGANSETLASSDGGATFHAMSSGRVRDIAGRCPVGSGGRAFVLGASDDGGTTVASLEDGVSPRATPLGRANEDVVSLACDERGLVAALRPDGSTATVLRQCAFGAACTALPGPVFAGSDGAIAFPVDVARVQGTTILALAMGRVVRVTSSRDAGASWTPFSVAFDGAEESSRGGRLPTELLAIGRRVLLYAAPSRAGETYPLLYSDDQGASWHGR